MKYLKIFYLIAIYLSLQSQNFINGVVLMKIKKEYISFTNRENILSHPLWNEVKHSYGIIKAVQIFPKAESITPEEERNGKVNLKQWFYVYFDTTITTVPELCIKLRKLNIVEHAEPWFIYEPLYNPNDSIINNLISVVKADLAWDIEKGDSNVIIAIIDTGTEFMHEDLIDNTYKNLADPINGIDDDNDGYVDNYYGWDFGGCCFGVFVGDNDPSPVGPNFHGTKVAGLAIATTDNGKGIASVGFNCKLMPIKVSPDDAYNAIMFGYQGIVYAADHGAKIINCSWGGYGFSLFGQDIINYATFNRNALVVAAAGNSFEERKIYPAAYENVLNVAITRDDDVFANTTYGYHIDICAPGAGITTDRNNTYSSTFGFYTSFSAPVASGAAAIVASYFPNFTAQQIAEQLRATADDIYNLNPSFVGKLGKGRINLYKALTISTPSIRIENTQFSKKILKGGDTIDVFLTLKNYLNPTGNLTVRLYSTNTAAVQILQNTQTYGSIPTLSSKTNSNPFTIRIDPDAPNDLEVWIKAEFIDGLYTDFQYFSIIINPTYTNIGNNEVITTVNSVSKWGYNDYPYNSQGIGFSYKGTNYLFEGGFLIARKSKVADNIRNQNPLSFDKDFVIINTVNKIQFPEYDKAFTFFHDTINNIYVKSTYYAFNNYPLVIFEYKLINNSFNIIDSIYTGLFSDWDIGISSNDNASILKSKKLAYIYDNKESPIYFGIQLLEGGDSLLAHFNSSAYTFSDSGKWEAIKNPNTNLNDTDIVAFTFTGPLLLPPKDSIKLVFAIFTKKNYNQLVSFADSTYNIYKCTQVFPIALDIGNDTTVCEEITISALTPGAVSYLWNTGQTTPNITINQSGTYSVKVYDSYGCEYRDKINITIIPQINVNYTIYPKTAKTGDTITFINKSPNSTGAIWTFGNGYGSNKDSTFFVYNTPGNYTISLYLYNSHCDTTVYDSVKIAPATNIITKLNITKVYPNPFENSIKIKSKKLIKSIKIYTTNGKEINYIPVNKHQKIINLEKLQSGNYILKILYLDNYSESILIIKK